MIIVERPKLLHVEFAELESYSISGDFIIFALNLDCINSENLHNLIVKLKSEHKYISVKGYQNIRLDHIVYQEKGDATIAQIYLRGVVDGWAQ